MGMPKSRRQIAREVDEILKTAPRRAARSRSPEKESSSQSYPDPLAVVMQAVHTAPASERFGAVKVFIYPLWERTKNKLGMDLPTFQKWLLEQNRKGALTLARADVPGAMNPQLVKLSMMSDRGATFHFVLDPAGY